MGKWRFSSWPLHIRGKNPRYALDRRIVIGEIGLDAGVKIKISHLARNQIPVAQPVA
jgi:hypothetical protein